MSRKLILASVSPRRRSLLEQLSLKFEIIASEAIQEKRSGAPITELVQENAREKAQAVASGLAGGVVLGADTLIGFKGQVIGKPHDLAEAAAILKRLSGNTHLVHTGIALVDIDNHQSVTALCSTEVTFKLLPEAIIQDYLATGEYKDKAGGYGIQGMGVILVKEIKGEYSNVVGLPLGLLTDLLPNFGIPLLTFEG